MNKMRWIKSIYYTLTVITSIKDDLTKNYLKNMFDSINLSFK